MALYLGGTSIVEFTGEVHLENGTVVSGLRLAFAPLGDNKAVRVKQATGARARRSVMFSPGCLDE
jgi:hypothetical protein